MHPLLTTDFHAPPRRSGDRLLWSVVGISAALTVLTLVASHFVAEPPGMPRGGRALPRIPSSPTTPGELLRTLGVGSLIWYACFMSAPLFVWLSRRLSFDRGRRATSVTVHLVVIALLAALTAWLQYLVTYRGELGGPPLGGYIRIGM